ncbi:MAG: DMT family transporter [Rhodobacterales bacterium]|nr:DMT family transporter [Rhodobacterales bacterium]
MTTDRPLLGVLLMLGFCIVAPIGDAVAKLLGASVPLGQLLLVRFAIQAAVLIPIVILTRRQWKMRGRVLHLTVFRTALHILGIGMMFSALKYLPLADAVAIAFVMPFIMLVLGRYVLNEVVGARRLIACIVGFIGTLLVVQPSFAQVGWPALLPIGVALNFSVFMLVTRQIAKDTDPIGLQAVSGIMATVVLLPVIFFARNSDIAVLQMIAPSSHEIFLLASIGLLGTAAHLLMTWSLRYAPSATLAPMQYLEIPFATLLGWLIFADFPNGLAAIGITITLGAGLYTVLRERTIARMAAAVAPQQRPTQLPAE